MHQQEIVHYGDVFCSPSDSANAVQSGFVSRSTPSDLSLLHADRRFTAASCRLCGWAQCVLKPARQITSASPLNALAGTAPILPRAAAAVAAAMGHEGANLGGQAV